MNDWLQAILPFLPFGGSAGSSPNPELAADPMRGSFLREMDREYPTLVGKQNPVEVQKLERGQRLRSQAATALQGAARGMGQSKPNLPAPGTKDEGSKKDVLAGRPKPLPPLREFLASLPSVTSRMFAGL